MRKRTRARECALKVLYQSEVTKYDHVRSLRVFWELEANTESAVKDFAEQLVEGVHKHIKEIDEVISRYAKNWNINRMALIDKNILRLATYEILYVDDIPHKVSINEAIDMAKKYGDTDSSKFVNGILDKISKSEVTK
ncbi:MAG: transcription antitermination factor NusB [Candidatus Omnitrophica bacterium]|nr:transcription antitermination factor NusB [Candidatus Omnitrophota bacterium]